MRIHDLKQRLREAGGGPSHEHRVLRLWSHALPRNSGKRPAQSFFPASLLAALPAIEAELAALARIHSIHPGADGSERLLVALADGQMVESVLLPRDGLCVSSQVGCAVGCQFCMTGRAGLLRQVSSGEIVAQVALARRRRPVRKVVFMGMGEPAHNLDNVMEAIELLGTAGNIGHKNLVFSTVGDPRVFERLLQGAVRPALALSLHTTRAALRRTLLPRAPGLTPEELVSEADRYARATGYPVQYQWTLLEGVNDGPDEIEGIVKLLSGRYGVLNMIPFNTVDGTDFRRPPWEHCRQIARTLLQRGILAKLRDSAGQDVDGGCGQLRARASEVRVALPRSARAEAVHADEQASAASTEFPMREEER
ncbi:RNA methyltransferase [Variovorax sp. OV329]|uniref:RNA methyltransferase n=1 Tax=Variovorax sp. OV329 TaxID=1882825 RepID=UPI0008F1DDFE|nr:RNA methyltransferase [Variovorax sp. OV329]SFM64083.1 23S rRNA (adenine2503-C2)-methyltransferase [Variovorax sp. OV329]